MSTGFRKATKREAKARIAITGGPGAGKTFTSLRIAAGLTPGGVIGVIDTERGSAEKYADRFDFLIDNLTNHSIDSYLAAIKSAADAGIEVLIIDSLSHGWQWLLERVDHLTNTKYRGQKMQAWAEATPMQRKLVDSLIAYPGHTIVTMRSVVEWAMEKDPNSGRTVPKRVGTKPQQREGIEYEFDLVLDISADHVATITKSRLGHGQDEVLDRPGEELGARIREWLTGERPAEEPPQRQAPATTTDTTPPWDEPSMSAERIQRFREILVGYGIPEGDHQEFIRQACKLDDAPDLETLTEALAKEAHHAAKAVSEAVMEWRTLRNGKKLLMGWEEAEAGTGD